VIAVRGFIALTGTVIDPFSASFRQHVLQAAPAVTPPAYRPQRR
jgi:hypothetical protein